MNNRSELFRRVADRSLPFVAAAKDPCWSWQSFFDMYSENWVSTDGETKLLILRRFAAKGITVSELAMRFHIEYRSRGPAGHSQSMLAALAQLLDCSLKKQVGANCETASAEMDSDIDRYIFNTGAKVRDEQDKYKVWPTTADQERYAAVMSGRSLDGGSVPFRRLSKNRG